MGGSAVLHPHCHPPKSKEKRIAVNGLPRLRRWPVELRGDHATQAVDQPQTALHEVRLHREHLRTFREADHASYFEER
jgi:hypothetical protein